MISRDYFRGKRVAVVGIGPHGEMINDIKFLIKVGALVQLYDLRSEARLKSDIIFLRSVGLISHVCGSVPAEDLLDMDLIILSHEYPRNSSFLAQAEKAGIQIEYPDTLFFKQAPPITIIGIMGACGKSTVMSMLSPMLETMFTDEEQNFFTIDPDSGDGIISFMKKIKSGDVVLVRVTDSTARELSEMHISPHVAVFTTVPPKGAYTETPFEILSYQTYNNFIVASDEVIDETHRFGFQPKGKMLRTKASILPTDWDFSGRGKHDRENAALAIQVARLFKVDDEVIHDHMEKWKPLKGHLELVKKVRGVDFYNDTASTSVTATQAGIISLAGGKKVAEDGSGRNLILIFGGADRGDDYRTLYSMLPEYVRGLVIIPGSGTMKERQAISKIDKIEVYTAPSVEEAVTVALERAQKGDRVLFSPGFNAGGFDQSRKERGERFVRAVRGLK